MVYVLCFRAFVFTSIANQLEFYSANELVAKRGGGANPEITIFPRFIWGAQKVPGEAPGRKYRAFCAPKRCHDGTDATAGDSLRQPATAYCTVVHCAASHCTVLHCRIQFCVAALHCVALYCTALRYAALHCTPDLSLIHI